jgi:hypothetical protein
VLANSSNNDVWVEEEHMGSSRRLGASITGAAEADVLIILDHSRFWRRGADSVYRLVARPVVDDHDLSVWKGILHGRDTAADTSGGVVSATTAEIMPFVASC